MRKLGFAHPTSTNFVQEACKDTRRTLQITISNMWWTKEALQVTNNRRRSIALVPSRMRDQCVIIPAMLLPSRLEETPRGRVTPDHQIVYQLPPTYSIFDFETERSPLKRNPASRHPRQQGVIAVHQHGREAPYLKRTARTILASILIQPENCI